MLWCVWEKQCWCRNISFDDVISFLSFFKGKCELFKLWGCSVQYLTDISSFSRNKTSILEFSLKIWARKMKNKENLLIYESFKDQWIMFLPFLLLIQLLQVYERVFRAESVNLFCYKGWSGGKQTRREAGGASAVQRKTWDIYSSVTTQRVNIKYSSSKSWRMVHSESSHFPILPLLHNTNARRPKSSFASLNLCNSSLENWDI